MSPQARDMNTRLVCYPDPRCNEFVSYLSFKTLQLQFLLKILIPQIKEMQKLSEGSQLDVGAGR